MISKSRNLPADLQEVPWLALMVWVGVYIIVIVSDWQLGDNYELTSQKYYPLLKHYSNFLLGP